MKFYSQTTSERKKSKELAMSILRYVWTLLHFRENLICKIILPIHCCRASANIYNHENFPSNGRCYVKALYSVSIKTTYGNRIVEVKSDFPQITFIRSSRKTLSSAKLGLSVHWKHVFQKKKDQPHTSLSSLSSSTCILQYCIILGFPRCKRSKLQSSDSLSVSDSASDFNLHLFR